jgi:hypothetical protein
LEFLLKKGYNTKNPQPERTTDESLKGEGEMILYPRDSNRPERGEEVGNALRELIEEYLEIERWNFHLSFTKFIKPRNIKIIYDSEWCRVKFMFSRMHYPETDEISIEYGRLHAPNEEAFMMWNGEGCRCWHSVLDPLRFLDGLTPAEAYKQVMVEKQLPPVVRSFRESKLGKKFKSEYSPKAAIALQANLWEHYGQRLFDLFDLRRPELWGEYRGFLKEYYSLLGLESNYGLPHEYVC